MTTDAELVSQAQSGSASAFARLVERYQERLLRFLLTRCASRADAEDAMQETFVSAFRYLQSYNPRWQFSTWLYRIALRNAARLAPRQATADTVIDDAPDPLEDCIRHAERENLWLAARRVLSQDAWTAMWLRYAEDLPVKEVARALGRPTSWTKVVLLRSRRRLAAEFNDETNVGSKPESKSKAYG